MWYGNTGTKGVNPGTALYNRNIICKDIFPFLMDFLSNVIFEWCLAVLSLLHSTKNSFSAKMWGIMWHLFGVDFTWTYFKLNVSTYADYLVKKFSWSLL